jgi:hypothetical protein
MVMQTLPVPAAMLCIFGVLMKLARESRNIKVMAPQAGPGGCDAHWLTLHLHVATLGMPLNLGPAFAQLLRAVMDVLATRLVWFFECQCVDLLVCSRSLLPLPLPLPLCWSVADERGSATAAEGGSGG